MRNVEILGIVIGQCQEITNSGATDDMRFICYMFVSSHPNLMDTNLLLLDFPEGIISYITDDGSDSDIPSVDMHSFVKVN